MDDDFLEVSQAINELLIDPKIQAQIDRSLSQGDEIGKAVKTSLSQAIASQFPQLMVCFNDVILSSDGKLEVNFQVLGTTLPPKLFLIYDGISLYDGNHHYHTPE